LTGVARLYSFSHKGSTDTKNPNEMHSAVRWAICYDAGVVHLLLVTYNSVAETGRRN